MGSLDAYLKREFDQCRENKCAHSFILEQGIDVTPFSHSELESWSNNRDGLQYLDSKTNFKLYGAIDDTWELPFRELLIVDYKAKATTVKITLKPKRKKNGEIYPTDRNLISYVNQLEFYQWLFHKNGFRVSNTGYFIFANAMKEWDTFGDRLDFEKTLLPCVGDDSWVEPRLYKIKES